MHGLGGNRGDMLTLAQTMGVGERYAVLAYDARGHGGSGGLIGIDGPKEVADVRAVFGWLRNRPDVADNRIGGWGVSYGGGAAWNSLVADVPWAALAISISWTDLRQALVPQGLAKTGVMAGFLGSLDPKRVDPEVFALRDAAFAGNLATVAPVRGRALVAAEAEGRQDTGLHDAGPPRLRLRPRARTERLPRARRPEAALDRPQRPRAVVGRRGRHARDARRERAVVRPLPPRRHVGAARAAGGGLARELARAAARGSPGCRRSSSEPRSSLRKVDANGIAQCGRYQFQLPRLTGATEVFGAPTVSVTAERTRRLVADRRRAQRPHAARQGDRRRGRRRADPRRAARRTAISLTDQATFLPKGSRLTLTLGSSSLAQNPANLLYLDLPFPATARLAVDGRRP